MVIDKYKAQLVVKGYKPKFQIDYKEVFALAAKLDTIRLVFSIAAQNSWPIYQLYIKSAFLHGELQEKFYVEQPASFVKPSHKNKVYKLKKTLYGLKQALRVRYSHVDDHFTKKVFLKCPYEHTLFTRLGDDGKMLVVYLYVDDLIYTSNDVFMFDTFKKSMMIEFNMADLGLMHFFSLVLKCYNHLLVFLFPKKNIFLRFWTGSK